MRDRFRLTAQRPPDFASLNPGYNRHRALYRPSAGGFSAADRSGTAGCGGAAAGTSVADLSDTTGGATRSALSGSTSPAPNCVLTPFEPRCFAVDISTARISSGVRFGFCAISSAATPDTWAVATEVPVVSWIELFGAGTRTSTPGAATAMYLPWLAPLNRRS